MAQGYQVSLYDHVDPEEFEQFMRTEVFPNTAVLRRNVNRTVHQLLRIECKASNSYLWLIHIQLVGSDELHPVTYVTWIDGAPSKLSDWAVLSTVREVCRFAHS